jgi:hypothetical protein
MLLARDNWSHYHRYGMGEFGTQRKESWVAVICYGLILWKQQPSMDTQYVLDADWSEASYSTTTFMEPKDIWLLRMNCMQIHHKVHNKISKIHIHKTQAYELQMTYQTQQITLMAILYNQSRNLFTLLDMLFMIGYKTTA